MLEVALQFFFEVLLQIVLEALVEFGLHAVREPFRKQPHPAAATVGYLFLGLVVGSVSLVLVPHSFAQGAWRLISLAVGPVVGGLAMVALGAWRAKRGQDLVRLDRFLYGYLFAVAFTLVRFQFAT
jgi:xanthine/uracil permease